jgi:hypothetical protein
MQHEILSTSEARFKMKKISKLKGVTNISKKKKDR